MARTLYLDCFAGASGDMLVGAMLDCGLDFELLRSELLKLGVAGYELSLRRVDRSGISAAKFDVHQTGEPHSREHHHNHQHSHGHHPHSHHRALSEIKRIISSSNLSDQVKQRAQAIFQRIGEAEAKIHDVPIEAVHFHEVGAIDSMVDIVGACVAFDALKIGRIISSPLHVGSGTFQCAHGTYPVPGPATAELLKGVPIYSKDVEGELVTPTGAAIISTLAESYGPMPMMKIEKIGYGAGTRDYPKFPNALRAIIGEVEEDADHAPGAVTVIEANIDDLNAQVFGYLMEKALAAGALDIFYTPAQMKKNRPGVLLTLLCDPTDRERMCELIFRETTTLGVRYRNERREILTREFVTVETEYGPIRIKVSRARDGRVMNASPEFEDCRVAAEKSGVGLRDAQTAALKAYAVTGSSLKN
jgi:pyridinium-3,5-bisthiocarboxylic acid mononucleotide nickel chelatase